MEETTLLTNADQSKRLVFETAINLYKVVNPLRNIWIEEKAFDAYGNEMENYFSIHDSDAGVLRVFWLIFDQIQTLLERLSK